MSADEKGPEFLLDQTISEIRDEPVDPAAIRGAADRVWARISAEAAGAATEGDALRTCADFQALIPAWRERRLPSARAMLLQDHTRECPACRKALWGVKDAPRPAARRSIAPVWKWAMAAGIAATALGTAWLVRDYVPSSGGAGVTVQALSGALNRVADGRGTPIAVGAAIPGGQVVRTAKDSGAVLRLPDGSLIEMAERTELSLSERRQGVSINLARGSVIVEAAKQGSRRLFVSTEDCRVSVMGTIFSVNHGFKGSRVAVIEGEVRVEQGNQTTIVRPGEQHATNRALMPVALQQEFSWSRNSDNYLALLKEFANLRQKLEAIPGPAPRYSSRLAQYVPEGPFFYASLPNFGRTLGEANRIIQEQLSQSTMLRELWDQKMKGPGGREFDDHVERLRQFSDYLGREIVVVMYPRGGHESPVALAETRDGFRSHLEQEIARHGAGKGIQILTDPLRPPAAGAELFVYIAPNGVAAASGDLAAIQRIAALIAAPGSGTFTKSDFYARIEAAYRNGVGWLFCADLQTVMQHASDKNDKEAEQLRKGFGDVRYLVVHRKEVGGEPENHAVLSFAGERRGFASWLAPPAPMRVLDYVSADAGFAAAFLVKDPEQLLDDVQGMFGGAAGEFGRALAEMEAKTGINVRADLAVPLGGEIAVALDGPLLPQPSWKLVAEVYDPVRFQQTIERLVAAVNRDGQRPDGQAVRLFQEQVGGRTFYSISGLKAGLQAHYVYEGGMLIAAANRDLLVRALEYRTTGFGLARSAKFTALLPRDGHTNFSAMVYHNLGSVMAPFGNVLTPEQRKQMEALASSSTPTLLLVYGEKDRIEVAARGTFFGLRLEHMLGINPMGAKTKVVPPKLKARV